MRPWGSPDCFVVINGPEDGTEFPISRSPFYIGREPSCAVNIRLDTTIQPRHARIAVVSDGYRVRGMPGARTYVGGKRVGNFHSRIISAGECVQVGSVMLVVECAPDGLAKRSKGIATESDLVWAIRQAPRMLGGLILRFLRGLWGLISSVIGFVLRLLEHFLAHWQLVSLAALIALFLFYPPSRRVVQSFIYWCRERLLSLAEPH